MFRGLGNWQLIADGSWRLLCCRAFAQRSGSAGGLKLQVELLSSAGKVFDEDGVQRAREVAALSSWLLVAAALQGLCTAQWQCGGPQIAGGAS